MEPPKGCSWPAPRDAIWLPKHWQLGPLELPEDIQAIWMSMQICPWRSTIWCRNCRRSVPFWGGSWRPRGIAYGTWNSIQCPLFRWNPHLDVVGRHGTGPTENFHASQIAIRDYEKCPRASQVAPAASGWAAEGDSDHHWLQQGLKVPCRYLPKFRSFHLQLNLILLVVTQIKASSSTIISHTRLNALSTKSISESLKDL